MALRISAGFATGGSYDESLGLNLSVNTPFVPFDDGEDDPDPLTIPDVPWS